MSTTSDGPPQSIGKLIVLCGIDGSGKTTQERLLADWITANGHTALTTYQPTDFFRRASPVRRYLDDGIDELGMKGLALLAAADRQLHLRGTVLPALKRGEHVICNRYVYSSYAYFEARGLTLDYIKALNTDVPRPDLTVLLDIPASSSRARVVARDGRIDKFEEHKLDFMERVRSNLRHVADDSFMILDGTRSPPEIHRIIVDRVMPWFGQSGPRDVIS